MVVLPLMIFHQMQLMVCAALARRYAARFDPKPAVVFPAAGVVEK
jgi:sodium/bile acid cotransporter 7